ncbi:nucleoside diphosphate kinase regulator [Pseudazoarcus pumilus]|uniref:Nucleoside diphosphate kinase regulator n=1 Tax=Pseudazoarcus pumilus TaxID=2067960 RepID=A0A2I6S5J9_9RHOO|nr:nucleoside diphosphate kinase regulator [Pseudazoarcus pumilus]AUN94530.1 nucleoside diphosphate kinase regulator [Pseudazoarcus pumilus]
MKPEIIVSSTDLDRLEGLLATPAARNRRDLDGLRDELDRAQIVEPEALPRDVVTMASRIRIRELPSGRERELVLTWPGDRSHPDDGISVFTPAGSALLGLSTGQIIDWPTVEGHSARLEVLEVLSQPAIQTA